MARHWALGLAAAGLLLGAGGAAKAQAPAGCAPGEVLAFVCGTTGAPEDLVQLPGTDWIVASGFTGQGAAPGGLSLIDTRAKAARQAAIVAGRPRTPYLDCDGPPDPAKFSTHGLSLKPGPRGRATLFAVGHGGREAIEVFEVGPGAGAPRITWIGCVRAPEGAFNNSVTWLKDGRLAATDFLHKGSVMADIGAGRPTGAVHLWRPGGSWTKLPGSDLPGANGIEATPDGRWLFVAVSGTSAVLRYDLERPGKAPDEVKTAVRTDNLRWAPDGRLLLAGPDRSGCRPDDRACRGVPAVAALDTGTLAVTSVLPPVADPAFPVVSAAIVVGDTVWLGAQSGDRVAYTRR